MFICLSVFLSLSHFDLINYTLYNNMSLLDVMGSYRPQCSYGKVMFLHLSVILSMGVSAPVHAGIHSQTDTPRQTPPLGRHPHWADTPSGQTPPLDRPPCLVHAGIHTPCPVHSGIHHPPCPVHSKIYMAIAADGTNPTGMHSC